MTTRFKIELEHLPDDVEVDIELWTSPSIGPKEVTREGHLVDGAGRRKEDFKFTRVMQTLSFKGAGFSEYVYRGQIFVIRERKKAPK